MEGINSDIPGVYLIYNDDCSLYYVGSIVISIKKRISNHKCELKKNKHCNRKMQNYFNKYGLDQFNWCILAFCSDKSKSEIRQLEKLFMIDLNALKTGWNLSSETEHGTMSIEGKKRMSDLMKIRNADPVYKAKLSERFSGINHPQTKLTKEQVYDIRNNGILGRKGKGRSNTKMFANKYNMTQAAIIDVISGKTHKQHDTKII